MIANRKMQNARNRRAASGSNVGSKVTEAQAGQAGRTFRKRNVSSVQKKNVIGELNNRSKNIAGSQEGLNTSKTARLVGNQSGYNNPSRQRSRYNSLTLKDGLPSTENISNPTSRLGILNKNVFDGTFQGSRRTSSWYTRTETSRSLMNKRLNR